MQMVETKTFVFLILMPTNKFDSQIFFFLDFLTSPAKFKTCDIQTGPNLFVYKHALFGHLERLNHQILFCQAGRADK